MAENQKKISEEDTIEPREIQDSLKAASPILIKILELVLALLCLSLVFVPYDNKISTSLHKSGTVWLAFTLPIIVNGVILISHFRRFPIPKLTLYCFTVVSGILLFCGGCILVSEWWIYMHSIRFIPPKLFMDLMMSSAVFSFFLSFITILDLYLTYKYY